MSLKHVHTVIYVCDGCGTEQLMPYVVENEQGEYKLPVLPLGWSCFHDGNHFCTRCSMNQKPVIQNNIAVPF